MEIEFLHHSSFLIKTSLGKRILLDPHKCLEIDSLNDITLITISHNHIDHNYIPDALKSSKCISSVGNFTVDDIKVKGIPSFHDKVNGEKRGENIIFILTIDGITLCHLGDLGHNLTKLQLENLTNLDVLFVPIGGNLTLNGKEAYEMCSLINPKIVIPMHYTKTLYDLTLDSIDEFIISMKNGEVFSNPFSIDSQSKCKNKVVIL